nr:LrgB family protein [Lysinibacillus sp. BF-4]
MMTAILVIGLTIAMFMAMTKLHHRFPTPLLLPIVTTTIVSVLVLIYFKIPYDTYMIGGEWLQKMLGPAVVALAYPLYNQRALVKKYRTAILSSIVFAMMSGLISVYVLTLLMRLDKSWILTSLPKSLTTPVAMQVSESINGIPPLTAVLVMVAGFVGAIIGPLVIKYGKIESAIARGVSIGSASHGVGLTCLQDYGEKELSVGSLAMGLSAVAGAFICPIFVYFVF